MYKQITGKEALKRIADGEEVHWRDERKVWDTVNSRAMWTFDEFLSRSSRYEFAIKTEPMRETFSRFIERGTKALGIDVEPFNGKRVRITVEEIEQ